MLCECVFSVSGFRGAFLTHCPNHATQEVHDNVQELPLYEVQHKSDTADQKWHGQRGCGH